MSQLEHDDDCDGCKPAMAKIDEATGKLSKIPDDDPMMVVVLAVWAETTLEERRAYHRVSCLNSRAPEDFNPYLAVCTRMKEKIEAMHSVAN